MIADNLVTDVSPARHRLGITITDTSTAPVASAALRRTSSTAAARWTGSASSMQRPDDGR